MGRRFFRLAIDVYVPGRWYLGELMDSQGQEFEDLWLFSYGRAVELKERLLIPVERPGRALSFDTAGIGQVPVVTAPIAAVFREMAAGDVQLFPAEVQGQTEPHWLVNVARKIRCIDDAASEEIQRYTEADGRPERLGEYRAVGGLRIDASKVGDARVFRLWGWEPPIIVDAELKAALEHAGIVGGCFDEV
jgi:uncharacterized membrane protein